jgi:hypothetical protein
MAACSQSDSLKNHPAIVGIGSQDSEVQITAITHTMRASSVAVRFAAA